MKGRADQVCRTSYKDNFRWEPDGGSMLHAVALDSGAVRSWRIPPLMAFHANQAWSEGDDLLIEIATFANADIFDDLLLERRRSDAPIATLPQLKRYRLRSGQTAAEVEDLGVSMELPQVHPAAIGARRASVCWGMGASSAPTDDELHALLQTVITRLMKMLTRRGVLVEDMGQTYLAEPDAEGEEARTLRPLQAAAITYRIAFGPRAGQRVLTLRGATPRETAARQPLCADIDGFSLHAAVRVEASDRKRLEQLCRYITRPALSDERVQLNDAGQVELKLKTPWRDGTTHLVMSPLEFMQRRIEGQLRGIEFCECYVSCGSVTADRGRRLPGRSTWGSALRR